jgi:hypothetical protein
LFVGEYYEIGNEFSANTYKEIPAVMMNERRTWQKLAGLIIPWKSRLTPAPATPASVLASLGATVQFRSAMIVNDGELRNWSGKHLTVKCGWFISGDRDIRHAIDKGACEVVNPKPDFMIAILGSLDWLRRLASREALRRATSEKFQGQLWVRGKRRTEPTIPTTTTRRG